MNKDKNDTTHKFHFVTNDEMYDDLIELSTRHDMNISGLIKYIMFICSKLLEEKHFTGIEQEFNSVVAWSKEIQVYFDDSNIELFKSLKARGNLIKNYERGYPLKIAHSSRLFCVLLLCYLYFCLF